MIALQLLSLFRRRSVRDGDQETLNTEFRWEISTTLRAQGRVVVVAGIAGMALMSGVFVSCLPV